MTVLDRFRLDKKVAIVTGASSGLGVTFALALAEAGADLAIGARREGLLEETKRQVEARGRCCVALRTDVTSVEDCEALVAAAAEELGGPHVLVNNAGINAIMPSHKEDPADFARIVSVNLLGAFQMSQAFARACIAGGHGGSIVNIASVMGYGAGDAPQAGYVSAKAGLLGLTRELAMQWSGRRDIRVNSLVPGAIEAGVAGYILENEEIFARTVKGIPMRRFGNPGELVGALLLLASDAGSYITGSALIVDGGWTIR